MDCSHEVHFAWRMQHLLLLKVECDFSWQAQHFLQFWEIAGLRHVSIFHTNWFPWWDESGLRSGGCEMTMSCSDHGQIIFGMPSHRPSFGGLKGDFTCSAHWE